MVGAWTTTAAAQAVGRPAFNTGRPSVIVSHPGRQHSHQVVLAAQQAGMLQRFVTSFYWRESDWLSAVARLVGRSRSLEISYLRRRWNPEIDPGLVTTFSGYHLVARPASRLAKAVARGYAPDVNRWADVLFDRWVSRWLVRQPKPTVFHGFEGSALMSFRRARSLGAKTVLDVPSAHEWVVSEHNIERRRHGLPGRLPHLRRIPAERDLADLVLVASDYVARCLREHGVPASRIAIVPYGVDAERFAPRRHGVRRGPFQVLFTGRVAFHKGIEYLLDAWQSAAIPDAELIVAGGIDPSVHELVRGKYTGVRFLGQVPSSYVHMLFQTADVFVLPSLSEGFGMVVLEAMASGVPVVTTSSCGVPVRDGIDGFVVPARNAGAFAEKLDFFYQHPDVRTQMGAAGRKYVIEKFTWQSYRRKLAAVYQALTAGQAVQDALDRV